MDLLSDVDENNSHSAVLADRDVLVLRNADVLDDRPEHSLPHRRSLSLGTAADAAFHILRQPEIRLDAKLADRILDLFNVYLSH